MADFGDRLRKLRRDREWTQEYVSSHLSVVRSTYAYYESGKTYPDYDTLQQLARMFSVSIDYLITGQEAHAAPADPVKTEPVRDASVPAYHPESSRQPLGLEWTMREIEQRLVVAFRHLSPQQQRQLLESTELMALQAYEKRDAQGNRRD